MKQNAGENTPLYPPSSNSPRRRQQPGRRRLREMWNRHAGAVFGDDKTEGWKREKEWTERARQGHRTAAAAAGQSSRTNDKLDTFSLPLQTGNPFLVLPAGDGSTLARHSYSLGKSSTRSPSSIPSPLDQTSLLHASRRPSNSSKNTFPHPFYPRSLLLLLLLLFLVLRLRGGEVVVLLSSCHPPVLEPLPSLRRTPPPSSHVLQD